MPAVEQVGFVMVVQWQEWFKFLLWVWLLPTLLQLGKERTIGMIAPTVFSDQPWCAYHNMPCLEMNQRLWHSAEGQTDNDKKA